MLDITRGIKKKKKKKKIGVIKKVTSDTLTV